MVISKDQKLFKMIVADLHNHTIKSGCGFATIYEMAAEAERKGIKILGITEETIEQQIMDFM